MKKVVSLILIFFYCVSIAQNGKIDSLRSVIKNCNEDTVKVNTLNKLAWEVNYSDFNSAIEISTQALKLSKNLKWREGIAYSEYNLGFFNILKGNYIESKANLDLALKFWDELTTNSDQSNLMRYNLNKGIVIVNLSRLARLTGDEKASKIYLNEAEGIVKNNTSKYLKMLIFLYGGSDGSVKADISNTIQRRLICIKLADEIGNKYFKARCLQLLGMDYYVKSFKKADSVYSEALRISEANGFTVLKAQIMEFMGWNYINGNDYERGLDYTRKAMTEYLRIGYNSRLCFVYYNIAVALDGMNNIKEAIDYYKRSIVLSDSFGQYSANIKTKFYVSNYYEKNGQLDLALKYYKMAVANQDSVRHEESSKKLIELEMNKDFEKKEALSKAELKQKEQQRNYFIIGFCIVALMTLIILRSYRLKQKANAIVIEQKKLVEEKQKEIIDSIHYAKRIQTALLTSEKYIQKTLKKLNKN